MSRREIHPYELGKAFIRERIRMGPVGWIALGMIIGVVIVRLKAQV